MKIPPLITATVDKPGPNARAMLLERSTESAIGASSDAGYPLLVGGGCDDRTYRERTRREAVQRVNHGTFKQPSPRPTVARVLEIVRTVIRARRQVCYQQGTQDDRDEELARAIVTNIAAEIATGDE